MSGSDRGGHFAAVAAVLTVAALLAVATATAIGWQLGRQQYEPYPAYKQAGGNQVGSQTPPRLDVQAEEYKHPCRDPQNRDESDLCAQYRAATGANDAADWAFYQLILSGLGLGGLLGTIYFTIRATNAAVRSNEIAQDTAKRQLRAYVTPSAASYGPLTIGSKTKVEIILQNSGQTPAYNLRTLSSTTLHLSNRILAFPEPTFEGSGVGMIGADGVYELNSETVPLTMAHTAGMRNGTLAIYVIGRVRYEDVFGDTHTLSITYESMTPVSEGKFRPCRYGNGETSELRRGT